MGEKLFVHKFLASFGYDWFDSRPDKKELAAGFEKQVLVEETVIKQCACLLPITGYHAKESSAFRPRCGDFHGLIQVLRKVVLVKPVTCLGKRGLPALMVALQMKLA